MSYDYTITIKTGGAVKRAGYQSLLAKLEMGAEIVHGRPLSAGGAPQVQIFISLLKKILKADAVLASFQGQDILAA